MLKTKATQLQFCLRQIFAALSASIYSSQMSDVLGIIKGFLPDWPEWALDVLLAMAGLLIVTIIVSSFHTPEDELETKKNVSAEDSKQRELHVQFDKFRRKYIAVYLVIM